MGEGFDLVASVRGTNEVLSELRRIGSRGELAALMDSVTKELGFRHYAMIHHDDLRDAPSHRIRLLNYPEAAIARIIDQCAWRRDPIIRGCLFSPHAFLWSELPKILAMDRKDRECLVRGGEDGLNEGITIPCLLLGECTGSCTFAGIARPQDAPRLVGMAQLIGIFAFQAARRIFTGSPAAPVSPPRLHPRPRDCVILAGQGQSNKQIARRLGLTPRTVDGYLREARRLFGVRDRTELVFAAIFAGEIGLHEVRTRQPA